MLKLKDKLAIAGATAATFMPAAVLAQDYDYDYTTTDLTTSGDAAAAAGVGIFVLIVFLIVGVISLISLIFWIMMLVHAAKNDIPDKNVWIIVLVASLLLGLGLVGALVYYFAVKRKFDAGHGGAAPASPPAAAK